jgi:hypothetical protein
MRKRKTVVITLVVGRTSGGDLYGFAEPDPAEAYVGDTIRWEVKAFDGVKGVHPDHFRLKGTRTNDEPFGRKLKRSKTSADQASFSTEAPPSGFTRIYKYDIMAGSIVVADPDIQIKD